MSVSRDGKPAHSIVRLVRRWQTCSLVEVELKTGRTHQIRVHLSHSGLPLFGDDKIRRLRPQQTARKGRPEAHVPARSKAAFRHPLTDQEIELASPLPAELEAFVVSVEQNEEREYG